jgi:hypothetical protein
MTPVDELAEDIYMSLSAPFTCCSIGEATFCAATSAEAPGYVAVTEISTGAIWGYWAIGKL